jgi:hypothetical protein
VAEDIQAICVDWNVEGRDAYDLVHQFGGGRYCRDIDQLLAESRRRAGNRGSIKLFAIRDALALLYGPDAARRIARLAAANGDAA